MDIVVVLELDMPTNVRLLGPDHTPADPESPVRRVHAAPAEASGTCGRRTLCGLDTDGMTLAPHRYAHQPPAHWLTCSTCQAARQGPAPDATEAAAQDHHEDNAHPAETAAR
ncbi:hypothetical protein [Kitasatospora sp. NPDC087271]|uniref:hypothetical protein n=1 Tax=Kitasatospora sp. NPDC087271 TaxID=3364067 RepID=UPI003818B47A